MRTAWAVNPKTSERQRAALADANRRRAARRAAEALTPPARVVTTPHLVAARAEFLADRPPLVVESLDARLRRLLPGAQLDESTPGRVAVRLEGREVTGWSVREAVDRAVILWGER
jgi:hypothetical protein